MLVCMLFVFTAIIELALVNFLDKRRKVQTAKNKARDEEHRKYIERLKTKFEQDLVGQEYANYMPRGVSLITDEEEPSRLRPFGKFKPDRVDKRLTSDSNVNSYPVHVINSNNNINNNSTHNLTGSTIEFASEDLIKPKELPDRALFVDHIMRIAYPILFFIFNVIYWPLLMSKRIL